MSEAYSDEWNLSGLIVQQDGKPQRVLSNFLRMNLNQRSPRGSKAEASKSTPAAAAQEDESQDTLTALLDHMQERLEEYPSIEEDLRQDLLVDVEALRTQLQRKNINRQVVLALLDPFIETEFLGDLLGRLKRLLDESSPDAT